MTRPHTTPDRPAPTSRLGRRPGPDSARADLLQAARHQFSKVGYERATVRAIAQDAGVDAALVYRFFGSKQGMLQAALQLPVDPDSILDALHEHPGDEGRTLVRRVLQMWSTPAVREQITALLRTAVSHEDARLALRAMLTEQLIRRIEDHLGTPDAQLRAALVATQMAGLAMTRFVIGIDPITNATDDQLVQAIGPSIQRYLTGDLS